MIGGTLRAFCAWCQREGGPAFLGEREPFDDEAETHGVCRRHLQGILAALPSHSFPDITYLFVIRPGEIELYDHLERAFLGVHGVKIIMERRQGDRRSIRGEVARAYRWPLPTWRDRVAPLALARIGCRWGTSSEKSERF